MKAEHLEVLVEEPSMEAFLNEWLPRWLGDATTFSIHTHQGKGDLIRKLSGRLRGYAKWLPTMMRIVVLIDRDDDDCVALKNTIERAATDAGLTTRKSAGRADWQVVSRLAIEELEAWFFGEWTAVRSAYPRVSEGIPNHAFYRVPDAIAGGTWEALERVLKNVGYFPGGLRKVEAAREIGKNFLPDRARSPSFIAFRDALLEAVAAPPPDLR
jgi:hypothetical protein